MKYKALISDVDGTLIPNHRHGQPSQRVIEAVAKVKDKIHIGVATARPYEKMEHIARTLQLSGPSIIHGGAQIMDLNTGKIYRQHEFTKDAFAAIIAVAKENNQTLLIDEDKKTIPLTKRAQTSEPVLGCYIEGVENDTADSLVAAFGKIPSVVAVKISSWISGKIDVSISPAQATKQHGILEVAEILGISTKEMIAIGDSYNDFSMLLSAGLKVAIGNAVPELKAIADYVAPSVEDDGVADVIEKFVLQ